MKKITSFLILVLLITFNWYVVNAQEKMTFLVPLEPGKIKTYIPADYINADPSINCKTDFLTFTEAALRPGDLKKYDVVWFHRSDTTPYSDAEKDPKVIKAVKAYVKNGGKLVLTNEAFSYINLLGIESKVPTDSIKKCADDGYGRKLGFHAFREHPLFRGMNGGAYILVPEKDQNVHIMGFFGDQVPGNGKVIAVDWDYIFLRENSKIIVEYSYGKGKVLAIGGYIDFIQANGNRLQFNRFIRNVVDYLAGQPGDEKRYYWDYSERNIRECVLDKKAKAPQVETVPPAIPWNFYPSPMDIRSREASTNFFDVAGERMLTMGVESSGIEEVWAHPFMAFRDYEAAVKPQGCDSVLHLKYLTPEIIINPSCIRRIYHFSGITLEEVIVNDPLLPSGVVHYELNGPADAELVISFKSNMRLMWPYSEKASGSLCRGWDKSLNAFVLKDGSGDFCTMAGAGRKPLKHSAGKGKGVEIVCSASYSMTAKDVLDFVYTASNEGLSKTLDYFKESLNKPDRIFRSALSHTEQVLSSSLMITTPDENFNKGYRWALVGTDRFFVNTPGMGKSLVAGYSTTKRGWDGGHKINGRPGYGWYFGRDGEWSGFALTDCGDFQKVKSELEFYNRFQDLNGKIFHEASTSGIVHYDAADATPLYIVLAGKYYRHTNDSAFIRQTWNNIKKALNFCFSTDTDHDHLIENTNVGHGWVEGGELYGSHATLYLNACWAAALQEASVMAYVLKDKDAEIYLSESETVKRLINTVFWDNKTNFYSYGMNKDRTYRSEPTVLPAVPLCFNLSDPEKAKKVLEQFASNQFSTNWGTRIVREESRLFNPKGYHYGSVWPLFTGWTSLAEYRYGSFNQGFTHLMNNLDVYKSWGKGFVEEVLNGSEYTPTGVCPHQCWSETMVLQPAIEGMLGLIMKAQNNKVIMAPHFPAGWDSVKVENIKFKELKFSFSMTREKGDYHYHFTGIAPEHFPIEFLPSFPAGTVFKKVIANGRDFPFTSFKNTNFTSLLVNFELNQDIYIDIETEKGIAALPLVYDPLPGSAAEGMRIISEKLSGLEYAITVEGKSGTSGTVDVYLPDQEIAGIENGDLLGKTGKISRIDVRFEKSSSKYIRKEIKLTLK